MWPPGQPGDTHAGRLVFNTNIHGALFNTAAGKAALDSFLGMLRANPAAVFPPRTFGRMALNGGSGLRLVNDPTYPCTCSPGVNACRGWRAVSAARKPKVHGSWLVLAVARAGLQLPRHMAQPERHSAPHLCVLQWFPPARRSQRSRRSRR